MEPFLKRPKPQRHNLRRSLRQHSNQGNRRSGGLPDDNLCPRPDQYRPRQTAAHQCSRGLPDKCRLVQVHIVRFAPPTARERATIPPMQKSSSLASGLPVLKLKP